MSLPNLPAGDKFRREVRTEWGGINLNENAGDGELIEALNMSSREYPLLANASLVQETEQRIGSTGNIYDPYVYNGRMGYLEKRVAGGTVSWYLHDPFNLEQPLQVNTPETGNIQYAVFGNRMTMMPMKQVYDFTTHTVSQMRHSIAGDAWFRSTTLDGVRYEANAIYIEGAEAAHLFDGFRPGDAVTIQGCTKHKGNNQTSIIREISGDLLIFSENTFHLDNNWICDRDTLGAGEYWFRTDEVVVQFTISTAIASRCTIYYTDGDNELSIIVYGGPRMVFPVTLGVDEGTELTMTLGSGSPYEETDITITREIPDMDYICVNENRMWGCKGDTIYASKLGDPLNWNVFDGLSTDSWTAETGTPGSFTGCCSFQGYPTFFKENAVFKVLGDEPGNFVLRKQGIVGVRQGSDKTIVEIRGKLYYHSWDGIMEWNGGDVPQIVSAALGLNPDQTRFYSAGSDSVRYFVYGSTLHYNRITNRKGYTAGVYVYDPRFGTWHMLSNSGVPSAAFAYDGIHGYMLKDYNSARMPSVYVLNAYTPENDLTNDTTTEWSVTFADSTRAYKTALTGSESKKGVLRLLIRCRLAKTMKVWISYDGGAFEEAGEFGGEDGMDKSSRVVPLILRRCDYWQLRLTGVGDAVIYSIAVEKYGGEWQQA